MFARLGRFTHRRRRWVLLAATVLTLVAAVLGPAVSDAVRGGGFADPGAESTRAAELLEETFGRTATDVVVLWSHDDLTPQDEAFAATVGELTAALPAEVEAIVHPWTPGLPDEARATLLSEDGRTAMAVVTLAGADDDARQEAFMAVEQDLVAPEPWRTHLAGTAAVSTEMREMAETDIVRAELLAMPVLLVLMTLIFRSVVAALLPVTIGVVAILGAMGLLRVLTLVTDVSTFALNVTTILGLGLAIDYALFMVSRFREELDRGHDVDAAVTRTVATAGRTVAFSGLTVLISFAGLLFFPQMFLRTMGLGGMAVVLLDLVLALTLLPALLATLGRRVDSGRLPRGLTGRLMSPRPRRTGAPRDGWGRLAAAVLRRPGTIALGATALLVVVALPALDLRTGMTDVRDLPTTAHSRQAVDAVDDRFASGGDAVLDVVVTGSPDDAALQGFRADLETAPGATGSVVAGIDPSLVHLTVGIDAAPDSPEARDLVTRVRDLPAPPGAQDVLVGGPAAVTLDSTAAITRALPATLTFVAGVTVVLLFLALGSVLLPVKAVLMNVASLAATTGLVVWAFGQGHLSDVLGFTETGRIDPSNLVLIALIAFGLAMDYELFLLSRIREEHLRGASTAASITTGLQRSGRTITSAALLLVVVLAAMTTSDLTFLQLIGLGLAFAVALDATIVRALLVPATMALLGSANWWLPAPLARLHARFGIAEGGAHGSHDDEVLVPPARELVGAGS